MPSKRAARPSRSRRQGALERVDSEQAGGPVDQDAEQLLVDNLELIETVAKWVSRQRGCRDDEREEFVAEVKMRLIEDDYRRLRRYRGESTFRTYLKIVIGRLFMDWMDRRLGRWRPSQVARALGPLAVKLDTLLHRDGYGLDEAMSALIAEAGDPVSRQELERLAARLPSSRPRRFVGEEGLPECGTSEDASMTAIQARERRQTLLRLNRALPRALSDLDPEERLLLRLHFFEGTTGVAAARALGIPQRRFYSRVETVLRRLRRSLEGEGLSREQVSDVLGWEGTTLSVDRVLGSRTTRSVSRLLGEP